ncbi:NADPH:quinone reductase [Arcobacter sp. CECT 8989]|uniref:zinc-binding alcohol dehydrogenase family protein n=1 Tax=Arcobacter sp. CECT 8989 TaxID=2044509 RepID=UPI00100B21AB|nr:zinc-binding alcohol dehydrogenase family protein [Arcobacter sp. CECT 8989]RXJ98656.1 NADPH:quinone reductase [Arcobacter sp. CECT 8989]
MKAIGFKTSYEIDHEESLIEFETIKPKAIGFDIVVKVNAVSMNPVDTKVRANAAKDTVLDEPKILGYDGIGIVVDIGDKVNSFKIGDRVYYAGDVSKNGSNSEFQLIDSRIVALSPKSLNDEEATVLPLTSLTAWEAMFDRMNINPTENKTILIIGGAGGVGSIATQIAKSTTNLTVIATASREETITWSTGMGANYVVNHRDLVNSVKEVGFETVDYIFNVANTEIHWDAMAELIAPQGKICSIVDTNTPVDINKLKPKSASFMWEFMFTRPMLNTDDIKKQGEILSQIASLVDEGKIRTTLTKTINGFSVASIKKAHKISESGKAIGKIAIKF